MASKSYWELLSDAQYYQLGRRKMFDVILRPNETILHFLCPSGADLDEVELSTNQS